MIQFERWSLLLIGAALRTGATRYSDFRDEVDISTTTLMGRLEGLVASGLMTVSEGTDASEAQYFLTDKGRDLAAVITALDEWSRRWALAVPTPAELTLGGPNPTAETPDGQSPAPTQVRLCVLGSFDLSVGSETVTGLSVGSQRLLAFLALHDRELTRSAVAGTMWPEVSELRAGLSLRSALSRLDRATRDAVLGASAGLTLADTVEVDLHRAQLLARRLVGRQPTAQDLSLEAISELSKELLPDWSDDWVVAEAEDWRQLRVSALETLAVLLLEDDRPGEAAGAARAAIRVDPLRESGYAALITVHLAKGDQSEALSVFDRYSELLLATLGLHPTDHLRDLLAPLRSGDTGARSRTLG